MNTTWTKFRTMMRVPVTRSASIRGTADGGPAEVPLTADAPARVDAAGEDSRAAGRVVDSDSLAAAVAALGERDESLAADVTTLRTALAEATEAALAQAGRIDGLVTAHRELEERLAAAALRERELEGSMQYCEERLRTAQQDWIVSSAARDRAIAGRLAGLYVVSIVALIVSIGTLVLWVTGVRV